MEKSKRRNRDENVNSEPPSTILIEMEGALVNSFPFVHQAYKKLMSQYGVELTKLDVREVCGMPPQEAIPLLCDKFGIKKPWKVLHDEFLSLIGNYYSPEMLLSQGAKEFVKNVSEFMNVCLISSMPLILTRAYLEAHQLIDFIDRIISLDNWEKRSYTSNIFLYALDKIEGNPEDTVVAVLTDYGVQNAVDSGMLTFKLSHKGQRYIRSETKKFHRAQSWEGIQVLLGLWHSY